MSRHGLDPFFDQEMKSDAREEVAKLVVGPPGIQAHVPLSRGFLNRVRGWFGKGTWPTTHVWLGDLNVWVQEDDDGHVDVHLHVLNMTRDPIKIHQFYPIQLLVGGYAMSVNGPTFEPPVEPIQPADTQRVWIRYPFGAPGVRLLIRTIQSAQNLRSSPNLEIAVTGSLDVVVGKRTVREAVSVRTTAPKLYLYCPSARV